MARKLVCIKDTECFQSPHQRKIDIFDLSKSAPTCIEKFSSRVEFLDKTQFSTPVFDHITADCCYTAYKIVTASLCVLNPFNSCLGFL